MLLVSASIKNGLSDCRLSDWEQLHVQYLGPGLARHFSLLDLVVGDWTSTIMFWSLPHQVDMVSRYFSHLEVLGSTGTCWTNEGMKQQIRLEV